MYCPSCTRGPAARPVSTLSPYATSLLTHVGPLAIAVPGQLRGMEYALNKFGRLPRSELFAPAIKLAREGFPVSHTIASAIDENKDILTGNNATFAGLR